MNLTEALFYGLAIAFSFGQFSRIPFYLKDFSEIKIYLNDLLAVGIFISWVKWHFKAKKAIFKPEHTRWLSGLWLILLFSWLINIKNYLLRESLVGLLYFLRFVLYSSLSIIIYDIKRNNSKINNKFIFNCFYLWTGLFAFIGIAWYLFQPDTRFLLAVGWDEHYYRVIGALFDPNFTGIVLGLGILASFWEIGRVQVIKEKKWVKSNLKKIIFPILVGIPFLLTYSRSSYLAFLSGVGIWLFLRKKFRYFLFSVFFFLILICLLPRPGGEGVRLERIASAEQRLESWKKALIIWRKQPLLGIGFNNYRYAQNKEKDLKKDNWRENYAGAGVENSFLFILVTSGVFGLMGLAGLMGKIFKAAVKDKTDLKFLILPSLGAILVHSLFLNSLFYPWVMIWLVFLLGILP